MVKLYYNLVKNPKSSWTIDMVPEMWRAEVLKMLENDK